MNLSLNNKKHKLYLKLTKIKLKEKKKTNPNPLLKKKPLVTRHLENTHKAKISTLKTTKCGKIMKLKSPSKCSPALQHKNHINNPTM